MRKRYKLHLQRREHLDRWLVSYADYMTLIFALFVVLYSVALVNKDKYRAVIDGMSQAFSETQPRSDGLLENQGDDILHNSVSAALSILESASAQAPVAPPISGVPVLKDGTALAELDMQLRRSMKALIDAGIVKLTRNESWLMVELSSGLLFNSGSAFLRPDTAPVINTIAAILKPVDNYIRVRGYTDNQQINNEIYRSNWTLSAARAEAVLNSFVDGGIAPQRLAFEGYGEFSPFADNRSEQGRLQNRKVVVAISKFAWVQQAAAVIEPVKVGAGPVVQTSVDEKEVKIVSLPNGGGPISTRQD